MALLAPLLAVANRAVHAREDSRRCHDSRHIRSGQRGRHSYRAPKYTFNFWRPITAIQNGDADDNARTEQIPRGRRCFPTPQHPEYLSGHSTNSSAMATVLRLLLGDEPGTQIIATSPTNPGFERHWARLSEGVEEVIEARIYAGIHIGRPTRTGLPSAAGLQVSS